MVIDEDDVFSEIPQPKEKFLLGNIPDIKGETPVQNLMQLAHEYGPIYQLSLPRRNPVVVSIAASVQTI